LNARPGINLLILLLASCAVLVLCSALGASGIGWPDPSTATGSAILAMRIRRVLAGFAVGAALACAGCIFQALLRNPLAEPYVLGVSSGAGLGAALAIISGLAAAWSAFLPLCAFAGAGLTLAAVFALASHKGSPSVYGLIISGVIVSSIAGSLLMFVVAVAPVEGLHTILWWMLGNLEPDSKAMLAAASCVIAVSGALVWSMAPELNALTLGTEAAHYVGVRTSSVALAGLALATLMTGAAVSMAGLIGFVGLIVPHVMRRAVGPDHRILIPASVLAGGAFLSACDAVGRTIMAPVEIPVGVVTALCGGPFFLAVLRRKKTGWIE